MTSNIENLFEVNKVWDLAVKTKNSSLGKECVSVFMNIFENISSDEFESLKKNSKRKIFSNDILTIIEFGEIMNKDNIPNFMKIPTQYYRYFGREFEDIKCYARGSYKEVIKRIIHCALNAGSNFEEEMNGYILSQKYENLEETFRNDLKDINENASIYKNNPRFKLDNVVNKILKDTPTLNNNYIVIELKTKAIVLTNYN